MQTLVVVVAGEAEGVAATPTGGTITTLATAIKPETIQTRGGGVAAGLAVQPRTALQITLAIPPEMLS